MSENMLFIDSCNAFIAAIDIFFVYYTPYLKLFDGPLPPNQSKADIVSERQHLKGELTKRTKRNRFYWLVL